MKPVFQTSFAEGFYDYQGIGELTCPNGWTPAWIQGPGNGVLHRPEYDAKDKEKGQPEVRTGRFAANFFTVYATHDGCLYARFRIGKGRRVRASIWCMNVTNSASGQDGGHGMRVGIDPSGGRDHTSDDVVYGEWWSSYMDEWVERKWQMVTTETVSQTDEITVFLHAKCDYAADINASHWDDFVLEVGEVEAAPTPTPEQPSQPQASDMPTLAQIEEVVRRVVQEELAKFKLDE
jgi:hypothetical protein